MERRPASLGATMTRRRFMKGVGMVAVSGAAISVIEACSPAATSSAPASAAASAPDSSVAPSAAGSEAVEAATILLLDQGDVSADQVRNSTYIEFAAANPGVTFDTRALPTAGEWDQAARTIIASGEAADLVVINGQFVRAWVRDGLLTDMAASPELGAIAGRIEPAVLGAANPPGTAYAVPTATTGGIYVTGLYYNKALLDKAGVAVPATMDDIFASVDPLKGIGVAPLSHASGDAYWNPLIVMWILPMVAGNDGVKLADDTMRGTVKYTSPEWIETFQIISDMSTRGVLIAGTAGLNYNAATALFLQGKVAMMYQGSWLAPDLHKGTPTEPFDLHVASLPVVAPATKPNPLVAYPGYGIPKVAAHVETTTAFLDFATSPQVDADVTKGIQNFSSIEASNSEITDPLAREFLPFFKDAITPLDWLWEPEITAEVGNQVQSLIKGDTTPEGVGAALQGVADQLRANGKSFYP